MRGDVVHDIYSILRHERQNGAQATAATMTISAEDSTHMVITTNVGVGRSMFDSKGISDVGKFEIRISAHHLFAIGGPRDPSESIDAAAKYTNGVLM
jgi:hypothetical protein